MAVRQARRSRIRRIPRSMPPHVSAAEAGLADERGQFRKPDVRDGFGDPLIQRLASGTASGPVIDAVEVPHSRAGADGNQWVFDAT